MSRRVWLLGLAVLAVAACRSGPRDLSMKFLTEDMELRVISDPLPPRAREVNQYKVVVRDRKTGEPIETGRGQIFATSQDGIDSYDPLVKGAELGTYYAKMQFVTAGQWALAIRFQRDSTKRLERMDWMQEVFPARGEVR
ncbi:MAG: hypothetical protein HUU26_13065 [Gemmatimonadaceae bacterium]|nr:hypothetical protein [Gemmatimonadaceae bacterium]